MFEEVAQSFAWVNITDLKILKDVRQAKTPQSPVRGEVFVGPKGRNRLWVYRQRMAVEKEKAAPRRRDGFGSGGCGGIGFLWEIKNDFAICVHWVTVRMGAL